MKENEILIHNNNYEILNVGFEEKKFEDYITEAELIEINGNFHNIFIIIFPIS